MDIKSLKITGISKPKIQNHSTGITEIKGKKRTRQVGNIAITSFIFVSLNVRNPITLFVSALFLFFSALGFSQNHSETSIDSLLNIAQSFYRANIDSAYYYSNVAHQKALKTNNTKSIAKTVYYKSTYLIGQKKFQDAQQLLKYNLDNEQALSNEMLGNTYLNFGAIYYLTEERDKALEHYFTAIAFYEAANYKKGLAKVNLNIGVIYEKLDKMDIANYFYDTSLSYSPSSNNSNHSADEVPYNISFEKKVEMSLKMLEDVDVNTDPKLASIIYYNLAMAYAGLNDYKSTLINALRSLEIKQAIGFEVNIDVNYTLIGKAHLRLANYNQAITYLQKAKEESIKRHLHISLYNYLIEAYTKSGNYKKALAISNNFRAFKDSINTLQENDRIAVLTSKFENEKQAQEILELQQEKVLQLAKEEKKQWQYAMFGLVLLLFILWLSKTYMSSVIKRKQAEREKDAIAKKVEKDALILNNKTKVYLAELKFIKSDGNYLELYTDTNKIIDRNKLKNILKILPPNFVKVHRSYIVNKNRIVSLNSVSLTLKCGAEIPVSRIFKNNLA
ncbi:LytTR family transcriptional regulator [Olleya sp. AH-315-F22]|nr:LytTR family transcriptional regulator [Olleya sp. AH-315-F22]